MTLPTNAEGTVKLLMQLIGEAAAQRMMKPQNYGGRSLEFPRNETGRGAAAFAALAEVVGVQHAHRLCKHFGGEKLYIPKLTQHYIQQRNRNIVNQYSNGMSVVELCKEHELSDRHIRDILKNTDMSVPAAMRETVQASLF